MQSTLHDYQQLLADIKQRVRAAQYRALQAVNQEQMQLYWELGRLIAERQHQQGWGKSVVETLARDLQAEFVGVSGFSAQNLWYMRQFYLEYSASEILQPLVGEISWAKHLLILSKCKDPQERLFYTLQTRRNNWTKAVLLHQLKAQAYQKTLLAQHNFSATLPAAQQAPATLALKDEYLFDFLELSAEHSEYELEQALLGNVRRFLSEMGGDFTFIGNQYRLELEGNEYFVDLLLFHRELQCLVAVELKIDEFRPEYAGKMNFYLSLLNAQVRKPHEQPSIGIIICQSKQRTVVEFALRDINKPIGVATYTYTDTLPQELRPFFPSNEELVRRLEAVTTALKGPA
ncbi:PDDEXK nuclease domain-containing protein [Hymenobacter weizhouensis]|uniref:PDDEXK nuclease domain-containing protein n=1 Tax=Hymenobacter sp. YIM 151500-1 TaxID=2987689 RepID=UPI0022266DFE|nr:PDDEXK nuclease domain-containing protein [Hymenobacter sp. YIM 151500-1]UYZ63390.1 PDDEXK nuclease domain-containing protein [Hymenobacter sp. YIM 151500-1]